MDCGHTDAEGLFYFDGRDDDICNINGRKVSSLRIEEAVRTFPGVAETAVKAVHEHGRDYLKVWIVWEKEAEREEKPDRHHKLRRACIGNLLDRELERLHARRTAPSGVDGPLRPGQL